MTLNFEVRLTVIELILNFNKIQ